MQETKALISAMTGEARGGSRAVAPGEYPEVNKAINLALPDEKFRRVGQSMAAASLPASK